MHQLIKKPELQRHYSIENYRAGTPQSLTVEPTPVVLKQRHDAVMARLHKEAQQWRRMYRVLGIGYACTGLIFTLNVVCSHWLSRMHPLADDLMHLIYFGFIAGFLWTSYLWRQTTKEMAASADVRDIGAFIDAMKVDYAITRPALMRLLPEMRTSDSGLLQEHHRQMLRRIVGSRVVGRSSSQFVIAILKAYEQVGDIDDIPVVEKIAAGGGYGKYKQVRQAAEDCLPALRIVAPQHREQVTLLRASDLHNTNTVGLVRPVEANSDEDPNEMLRATIGEVVQP
jgi:hypothetical protein